MNLGPTTRQSKRIKIKALWERGDSQRQIAKAVGCNLTTVERWISRFKDTEEDSVPENVAVLDQPRSGAPPKITKSIGKAILKFTEGKTSPRHQIACVQEVRSHPHCSAHSIVAQGGRAPPISSSKVPCSIRFSKRKAGQICSKVQKPRLDEQPLYR